MILLNPGPVNVTERVRKALCREDLCHREEEFSLLLREIREKLLELFAPGGSYTVAVLTGSGTAAVEAALCAAVDQNEKLLVVNNGVYGKRMTRMAQAYGIRAAELECSWQDRMELSRLEQALRADGAIGCVAIVHHETTTGMINPVEEVTEIARRHGKRLLVDSVSGLGGEPLLLSDRGAALCAGTAGKCIQGFPGVCFVLIQRSEMERLRRQKPRNLYLDLAEHHREQENGTVPFTPAVQIYQALDEALAELREEGLANRIARYREAAGLLREGFQNLGLRFLLPADLRSNTLTSLRLPDGVRYERLHDQMKRRGYVIYAGQENLQASIFRVANMGALGKADFEGFLHHLGEVLK